ncbi:MAG: glycosyl hydrolase [Oceanospirillales bacterium]|nr:glycosyl hydrolase [Oceanospirillales bacterium]
MKPPKVFASADPLSASLSALHSLPRVPHAWKVLSLIVCPLLMAGCEAPLDLAGIDGERNTSVRRTDQILSLAVTDRVQVAVGSNGLVLTRASDAGEWQRQTLSHGPNLIDVDVCPDGSLIALSFERQLWTANAAGQQWQSIDLPTPENLLGATCAPDGSYWAVGSFSTLLSSDDGGRNWFETTLNEDAMLTSIQFLDTQTAYTTGEFGLVARTDDGGQTWQPLEYIPNDFYPQAAHFRTEERGWVVGLDGQIMHTRDGGVSWQAEVTPVAAPLYGLADTSAGLFAVGENGTVLVRSGQYWERLESPALPVWLRSAVVLDNGELLVAGGAGTLMSLPIQ